MKLFALVALTMVAFAANSILNRLALAPGDTGPASYGAIRLAAGAVTLGALIWLRRAPRPQITRKAAWSAATLLLYAIGFSYAYISLPAGAGALILFGGVQVFAFSIALLRRDPIGIFSWAGASMAFAGLTYLLWPAAAEPLPLNGSLRMLLAAFGWTLYTNSGRGSTDPLGLTALAFVLSAPFMIVLWVIWPDDVSLAGAGFAVISGAVTSGLGYALWYKVLPNLSMPTAAVAQLTVPVIAAVGGALVLGEVLNLRFAVACIAVLGGVGLTIWGQSQNRGS
jgi:drug/metabolite transporter (DMT)-like permease